MIYYRISPKVRPEEIAGLRKSIGWNSMDKYYSKALKNSYFYICCYEEDKLIGFVDVVSNKSTDAYIQDLMVDPVYQRKGIGSTLVKMAIEKLKEEQIYMISVLFDEDLLGFYKKFGFNILLSGQMQTHFAE